MTTRIRRLRPHLRVIRRSRLVRVAFGLAATFPALGSYHAAWYWELAVGITTGSIVASWAWKPYEMIQDRLARDALVDESLVRVDGHPDLDGAVRVVRLELP